VRKSKVLGEAVLKKEKRRDDPQHAERAIGPDGIEPKHVSLLMPRRL
jgi:hypothetical protein